MTTPYVVPVQYFRTVDTYGNALTLLNPASIPSMTFAIDLLTGRSIGRQLTWPNANFLPAIGKFNVPDLGVPVSLQMDTKGSGTVDISFVQGSSPTTNILTSSSFTLTGSNSFTRATTGAVTDPIWILRITPNPSSVIQIYNLVINA